MKKLLAFALVAALSLGVLAGCESEGNAVKDTVTFLSWMRAESFDPSSGLNTDKSVMHSIFDTLIAFTPDGGFAPMLAESWEESEDGMSTTFKLREDVKFHNGDVMTADDVIYTFDTMLAEPTYYYLLDYIKSYEKLDDYNVRIDRAAPYANLMEVLVENSYIMPSAYHVNDPAAFEDAPVGTGPYKFVSQEVDDSVILVANEEYYGDAPGFKNLIIKPPLEPANAVIALETGEVDIVSFLPAAQAALIEANKDLTLVTELETWSAHTLLLMMDPLHSDNNLRKALFHGINRDNAIQLGNEGIGKPSENMFAERIMGDYAGIIEGFVGYDEELAKDYLSKSDYNGQALTLSIFSNAPVAESIQSDLKKIGINIEIELLDTNSFFSKLDSNEIQIALAEFGTDVLSTEDFMFMFGKDNPYYGVNMAQNDEYEALLAHIRVTTDDTERREQVKRAQEIMFEMANIVPLFDATFNYSYGPGVTYDYKVSAPTYVYYLARVMPASAE